MMASFVVFSCSVDSVQIVFRQIYRSIKINTVTEFVLFFRRLFVRLALISTLRTNFGLK